MFASDASCHSLVESYSGHIRVVNIRGISVDELKTMVTEYTKQGALNDFFDYVSVYYLNLQDNSMIFSIYLKNFDILVFNILSPGAMLAAHEAKLPSVLVLAHLQYLAVPSIISSNKYLNSILNLFVHKSLREYAKSVINTIIWNIVFPIHYSGYDDAIDELRSKVGFDPI